MTTICLIGFGEVGALFADKLAGRGALTAWDIRFLDPEGAFAERAVRKAASAADAVREADVVLSAVTASQTVAAATAAAPGLKHGAYYVDLNSASPAAKIEAAAIVETAGALYVEAAVMAPVEPKALGTPILLGGPRAAAFLPIAEGLGFSAARVFDEELGRASAAKLCRSVIVKGMEALLVESLMAARHYGVERDVVGSLSNLFPGPDWERLSHYMITRAIAHGARRAEEMREAARTVADAGVEPLMSEACASRQDWCAEVLDGVDETELSTLLDAMRAAAQLEARQ